MTTTIHAVRALLPAAAILLVSTVTAAAPYGTMPMTFEANEGQAHESIDFVARGAGYAVALQATDVTIALRTLAPGDVRGGQAARLRMRLVGAKAAARAEGLDRLPGTANYFVGNDATQWRTRIPTYGRVRYGDVLPGVDVIYYGNQRRLEYDFVVKPGSDPDAIVLAFEGAAATVDPNGDLLLAMPGGTLRQHEPVVYQDVAGARREIAGSYRLLPDGKVGFEVAVYDRTRPLVIDPVLSYATFLGGQQGDTPAAIAVDAAGNAYVAGLTVSTDFPTTSGAFQSVDPNAAAAIVAIDAFVARFTADGALVYSTYLGGAVAAGGEARNTVAAGIAVDGAGNAYITGGTGENNFPITPDAYQPTKQFFWDGDAFVSKLSPDGSQLLYSTFLGGGSGDQGGGIALDPAGNIYVTGHTISTDFPVVNALQPTFGGVGDHGDQGDLFVTKLNPAGSALVYSTYLGGSRDESFNNGLRFDHSIAVDAAGNAYVAGDTTSGNFPTTPNAFQEAHARPGPPDEGPSMDGFVTKIGPTGALVYSTFLGGQSVYGQDSIHDIAVDGEGHAYVTGVSQSGDFPLVNALPSLPVTGNGFVTKLSVDGSSLVFSTPLSCYAVYPYAITIGADGQVYVAGRGGSHLPIVCGASNGGAQEAFVVGLASGGSAFLWSTLLGGSALDEAADVAVDPSGNVYVAGVTLSSDFPTTAGAVQPTLPGGAWDGFVAKISSEPACPPPAPPTATCPEDVTVSAPAEATSATVTFGMATASGTASCLTTAPCAPASGSSFPVGDTTVTCTARDVTGLSTSCDFTVTVLGQPVATPTPVPTATPPPPFCGNGIRDAGEVCDDGLESGAPGIRDSGDDVDACPNGPALTGFGLGCRVAQHCGDAIPFLIDSSSRCVGPGCAAPPLEECDNGGGTILIGGGSSPASKTCRNAGALFCTSDAECGAAGPCGNSDTTPGACTTACLLPADDDGDGIPNAYDVCPLDVENDADADGVCESVDNCDTTANSGQADTDGDQVGDACDPDIDGDGVQNVEDNCPFDVNPTQADYDSDGAGDACDTDVDGDGVIDAADACLPSPIGVPVDATGCTIDELCPCAHPLGQDLWKNHGAYVSCVAHAANDFVAAGLITPAQHDAIVSAAGESSCGKKIR